MESHQLLTIDGAIGTDSAIYKFIEPYRDSVKARMSEVIGFSEHHLVPEKPESALSSFVADLVLAEGIKFLANSGISDVPTISVINIRGLRAPLPEGEITIGHAFKLMPFENQMTAVKLNGSQMVELFNHIALSNGDGISGASFRLEGENASEILIAGNPLQADKNYWVITSDFVASGGDGYIIFQEGESKLVAPVKIRDIIIAGIRELHSRGEKVTGGQVQRIRVKNPAG